MKKGRGTKSTSVMNRHDLSAVWTVLESEVRTDRIDTVATGYRLAAGDVLAGVDGQRSRYLLIPLLPGEAARVETSGRSVQLRRLRVEDTEFLAVVCVEPNLHGVFTQFARELLASLVDSRSPAKAAAEAYTKWRALFAEATSRQVIKEEALVGLLGELLTLETLLAFGAPGTLAYWEGPLGGIHDFRTDSFALEVKSSLARHGRMIPISSIDQLDAPPSVRTLALVFHRLTNDPSGFSLGDLIERLTSHGASIPELDLRLSQIGVTIAHLEPYRKKRYRAVESRIYIPTRGPFPRIVRSMFTAGDIPPGITQLSYIIDLTNEPPHPLSSDEAAEFLRAVAKEAGNGLDS